MHDRNLLEDQPIAWTPTPDVIERAQLTKFMRQVGVKTWDELYEFSIRDVAKFTEEVLKFLDIKFDPPYERLLDTTDGVEFPKWFSRGEFPQSRKVAKQESEPGAVATGGRRQGTGDGRRELVPRAVATGDVSSHSPLTTHHSPLTAGLNITTMCLDRWQTEEMKDQPAVIWEDEDEIFNDELSYEELWYDVDSVANGLRRDGLSKGDAIGIHLPMMVETVIALLAIGRIGAIAVPIFSGYGVEAIASRLNAVGAKSLITCTHFSRRGKKFDSLNVANAAIAHCPTISKAYIVSRRVIEDIDWTGLDERFEDFFALSGNVPLPRSVAPTAAEDPLIILYTSGTTGKPKGIAHTHASFPIKAAQDMAFGTDVGRGTRISWYTDIGWMMGPWLIYGALINGATICIYDGAPDYPTPDRMWEFCAKHKVEVLGISPTLVRALAASEEKIGESGATGTQASCLHEAEGRKGEKDSTTEPLTSPGGDVAGKMPAVQSVDETRAVQSAPHERHDLSNLRMFASTGEPWNPAPWWWLFEKVGNSKRPIINYSGGTEIAGGILMGNPLLPIKPCSFPAPCPGMDVDILDDEGKPVGSNEVGELVIKQPWIGMARGFWQEKERYLDTYWRRFKDIWVHGDWAMRDKDGHWFILGRSDDTLKVAGKRVGPAEVESILIAHPDVVEAAVIGVPDEAKGTAMVAFCVLGNAGILPAEEAARMAAFQSELKSLVARDMGKPLSPSKIHFVSALPKTRNAKVMRRVLRSAYLGEDPGDLSALEDPQTVDEIRNIPRT